MFFEILIWKTWVLCHFEQDTLGESWKYRVAKANAEMMHASTKYSTKWARNVYD